MSEEKPIHFFEFRDVCKSFDGRLVLDRVSFTVKRGETCVIMGRSGVGKSVSLKHIMGFLKAEAGQVFIDGQDVTNFREADFEEVRRKVTMVFQSGALFDSLTVAENIAFPLDGQPGLTEDDVDAYVMKIAHMLEVDDVMDKLRGHRARAGAESRSDFVRRADDHGGSHHGGAHGRPDPAIETGVSQNVDRGDARHPSGEETRRCRRFSPGRQSHIFRSLGRF